MLRELKTWFNRIFLEFIYALPIHRAIYMVKYHQAMVGFWFLLALLVGGYVGKAYGITYVFLGPEYLNQESFWSFFIVGISLAGFIVSYHITGYILDAYRYNFLGAVRKPFLCFSVNNSLIPLLFLAYYAYKIIDHQVYYEGLSLGLIVWRLFGLGLGMAMMFIIVGIYFSLTNQRVLLKFTDRLDRRLRRGRLQRVNVMERLNRAKKEKVILTSYFSLSGKVKRIYGDYQYDKDLIVKVFDQTQLNAVLIQFISILSLLFLGIYRDVPLLQLPAAASSFLLFSVLLMLLGAVSYWLKGWALTVGALLLFSLFKLFPSNVTQNPYHQAFGLDYSSQSEYSIDKIEQLASASNFHKDSLHTIAILERWKEKAQKNSWPEKPKIAFTCASGGGLLASLWTLRSLQYLDSATQGRLLPHTALMTGSSGGMLGTAYFRELALRKEQGENINLYDSEYTRKIALDKLNPTVFSFVVADLMFRFQQFKVGEKTHYRDRGYSLERQFLIDTDSILDKPIIAYQKPEEEATIPMLFLSPTIVNDGRKLHISSQPISYMNVGQSVGSDHRELKVKGVEFRRLFAEQDADSLRFMTALRMNATFPYITPNVILPSKPSVSIMDAGLSDNFGVSDAIHFMYVFREWIEKNTSGVILLSVRVIPKEKAWVEQQTGSSTVNQLLAPITGVLGNLFSLQDIGNEADIEYIDALLKVPLHQINFEYLNKSNIKELEEASLSWRLTKREQRGILNAVSSPYNQNSLKRLQSLLLTGGGGKEVP